MGKRTALHNVIVLVTALLTAQSIKLHCATMLIFGYMSGSMLRSMPVLVSRKVQRLPSGQRMDPGAVVASYMPDKSLGPPLGEKSTIKRSLLLLSLTTCPVNVHGVPLPSGGHPGFPSVPVMRTTVRSTMIISRRQPGCTGSLY